MEDSEERKLIAKKRRENAKRNRERYREIFLVMNEERNKALKLMRRRHAYYTKIITDAGIKTAEEFYDNYKDHFEMYGTNLTMSNDNSRCAIYLELGDGDYEEYRVMDGKNGNYAEVSPEVAFKELFNNVEVNLFTGEVI